MKIKKLITDLTCRQASHWLLITLILLSWPVIKPILVPGFFPIHDQTQVVRVQQMAEAYQAGQFPVRWVGDLGYGFGYPIFNFYAPLAYYLLEALHLLGLNYLHTLLAGLAILAIFGGVGTYLLGRACLARWRAR